MNLDKRIKKSRQFKSQKKINNIMIKNQRKKRLKRKVKIKRLKRKVKNKRLKRTVKGIKAKIKRLKLKNNKTKKN